MTQKQLATVRDEIHKTSFRVIILHFFSFFYFAWLFRWRPFFCTLVTNGPTQRLEFRRATQSLRQEPRAQVCFLEFLEWRGSIGNAD